MLWQKNSSKSEVSRLYHSHPRWRLSQYSQVQRSGSTTPLLPPWDDFDPDPTRVEEDRLKEDKSHEALIEDNGRPCYPIELGFGVFDNEQYKDILEYWQTEKSSGRLVFSTQLSEWQGFRRRQLHDHSWAVRHHWFHRFQELIRERRRKFGLDGDVHLREEVTEQSKLEDWVEYQDLHLREYEKLEESFKTIQEKLLLKRKELAEEAHPVFEEIEGLEFGRFFGMNMEWGDKVNEAKRKQEQMEHKLRVVKTRLEAAQSKELEEKVERDRWIELFAKEVESKRKKMDEFQGLYNEAKRAFDPYDNWWEAKLEEWKSKGWDGWTEEGRRLIDLEEASAEHQTEVRKMEKLKTRRREANSERIGAKIDLEFAEEVLGVARTEDLAPIVERAALLKRTQKEVRFAEFHVEEEKESRRVLSLKWGVLSHLYTIPKLKGEMKRLNVLLNWIEQQRQELIGDDANAIQESGPRRSKRVSAKDHTSSCVTKASDVDHTSKARVRSQKPSTTKSILDPVDPGKVTKALKQKRKGRRRTSVSRDISRATEKTKVESKTAEPKSDAAVPVKEGIHARLRSVHSSRVSKPASKKSLGRQKDSSRLSSKRARQRRTVEDKTHTSLDPDHSWQCF